MGDGIKKLGLTPRLPPVLVYTIPTELLGKLYSLYYRGLYFYIRLVRPYVAFRGY